MHASVCVFMCVCDTQTLYTANASARAGVDVFVCFESVPAGKKSVNFDSLLENIQLSAVGARVFSPEPRTIP